MMSCRWYLEGEEVTGEDENIVLEEDGSLTFLNVTSEYNGEYVCEAENSRGKITQVVVIAVYGKL